MSAREEILHLINRYTFTIDTGDLEGFANLFEYGEWIMRDAASIVGRQQVREAISRMRIYPDGTPRTKHVTSNIDIDVDEESGTASSECYVTVFQQTGSFPLQPVFSGHYFFSFRRERRVAVHKARNPAWIGWRPQRPPGSTIGNHPKHLAEGC